MRKLGYLIPLLMLLAACGPEETVPPSETIPPDEPAVEMEKPSEGTAEEGLPDLLFDAQAIRTGDAVGPWTVESVEILPHAVGTEYSANIAFEGRVVVEGTYTRHRGDDLLGGLITFRPEATSAEVFPRMTVDDRYIWFAFDDQGAADAMLPSGESGEVTIELSSYTIHFAPSDVHNTAGLEAVR